MTDTISKQDYQSKIISFNADPNVIRLREHYNETSFFEIISKERSETTYSSFLRWVLDECSTNVSELFPLFLLLDILAKKDNDGLIDNTLKIALLSRSVRVVSLKVETEKVVASLACEAKELEDGTINSSKDEFEKKCKDKIDLFIRAKLQIGETNRELQIVIENKIDSDEGKEKSNNTNNQKDALSYYNSKTQTQRYYIGTKLKNNSDIYQLYVYLTPDWVSNTPLNYIHINYKDILDGIIAPLLVSSSLSSRMRFFLEEFRNQITYPSLNKTVIKRGIATSNEQSELFNQIWKDYDCLIIESILAATGESFWTFQNQWYTECPKREYAQYLFDHGITAAEPYTKEGNRKHYNTLLSLVESCKDLEEARPIMESITSNKDKDKYNILVSFWEHNKRFLTALLGGISEEFKQRIIVLIDAISKRDTTKYTLVFDGKPFLNLSKRGVILKSAELWFKTKGDFQGYPQKDSSRRDMYFESSAFEAKFNNGEITEDTFSVRYSPVLDGQYYIINQWGASDNWDKMVITLNKIGFTIIPE